MKIEITGLRTDLPIEEVADKFKALATDCKTADSGFTFSIGLEDLEDPEPYFPKGPQ